MDLFAAPSRTEGLGMAIIEALAAGIPVIGSRVGGIPEVIEEGVCGRLLTPEVPAEWADALAHYATHRGELESWARAAPARARRFSVEASGLELERVYERLLDLVPSSAALAEAA
jgi:glycosyltransferase involved in cell wall biosynthesis